MAAKKRLGRGLSALIGDNALSSQPAPVASSTPAAKPAKTEIQQTPDAASGVQYAPIEMLNPNPNQPRKQFDEEQLNDLAASIRRQGVLQPIIVRPDPVDAQRYEIVAGERRWRAAQMAQMHDAPIIVKDLTDAEAYEVAVIENVQREDLNPIEEAASYAVLVREYKYTQEKLAEAVGKSRPNITNSLRLLKLPDDVQDMIRVGDLTAGHGRTLLGAPDPSALARTVLKKGMNVRTLEATVTRLKQPKSAPQPELEKDADTRAIEAQLSAALRVRVRIDHRGDKGGTVTIAYDSLDKLDEICRLLSPKE